MLPTASSLNPLGPVRPLVLLNGHGHFNEVFFEDVVVPKENLVGPFESGLEGRDHDFDVRAQRATVALAAEMCGGAQQVLDMTVAYAKLRVAFGKPIGSYQGVKHPAADMLVALENAKSLTYYAVWPVDRGLDEFRLASRWQRPPPPTCPARSPVPASNCMAHRHDLGTRSAA
jgi:alkylation response protein AidB-like acyl-CoA dehydrogenase